MRFVSVLVLSIVLAATAAVAPVAAKPPLREVSEIDDGLLALGLADEIRKECDGISARMLRALSVVNGLKSRARDLGYSDDEIEDYVTSKDEKRRMRARGEAWLAERGVTPGDSAALCKLGAAEIARGSAIGQLLR